MLFCRREKRLFERLHRFELGEVGNYGQLPVFGGKFERLVAPNIPAFRGHEERVGLVGIVGGSYVFFGEIAVGHTLPEEIRRPPPFLAVEGFYFRYVRLGESRSRKSRGRERRHNFNCGVRHSSNRHFLASATASAAVLKWSLANLLSASAPNFLAISAACSRTPAPEPFKSRAPNSSESLRIWYI